MHCQSFGRAGKDKEFIDWLMGRCRCSEKIVNGILKFSDQDFDRLKSRVQSQPDLLTALAENGYDCNAIHEIFCCGSDQKYNDMLDHKEFIIELLKNKCPNHCLKMMCSITYLSNLFNLSQFLEYKDVYITLFKYFPYSEESKERSTMSFYSNLAALRDSKHLDKCRSNLPLFRSLVREGAPSKILESPSDESVQQTPPHLDEAKTVQNKADSLCNIL